jgi:hypothetical protein
MVKITLISLPSSSVTPAVTAMVPWPRPATAASSKSDGRMPKMTLLQPGDRPQRGRLTAPGRTDEHHELAVGDVQAQIIDGPHAARVRLLHTVKDYLRHW